MPNNLWFFFWGGGTRVYTVTSIRFCLWSPVFMLCCTRDKFLPCRSRLPSVPCQMYIFRFARILNGFWWNLRELITTTNRLNDYILGEIGTGTRERYITREKIRTDVNRFRRDVKQVLTPSEWSDKFHCADDGRHGNVGTETFTTKLNGCRQMQQRRHHMTECGLYLSS